MNNPLLKVSRLTKNFPQPDPGRKAAVLKEISFSLKRGESLGIIGESGAGKTTLLRCILGLLAVTEGAIYFDGLKISHLSGKALMPLRKKIQIVWQDPYIYLNPYMKALDLVKEPLDNYKVGSKKERLAKAKLLLRQMGLQVRLGNHYPHELSGGQCQKVALARAFILNPELMLFDEAISSLDIPAQVQMIRLLKKLKCRTGLTYLFVSHDIQVVKHLCSQIIVLNKGKIVETGDVKDVCENPSHPYTRSLLSSTVVCI